MSKTFYIRCLACDERTEGAFEGRATALASVVDQAVLWRVMMNNLERNGFVVKDILYGPNGALLRFAVDHSEHECVIEDDAGNRHVWELKETPVGDSRKLVQVREDKHTGLPVYGKSKGDTDGKEEENPPRKTRRK